MAANALYTALRRCGTTRQLAGAIIICAISALLLLPAILWFNLRFSIKQATLPIGEVGVVLAYIALCGWLLPLGITISYWLFTLPRSTTTAVHIPSQKAPSSSHISKNLATTAGLQPPRPQPGELAPYVFSEDMPWCWLEYRTGSFQGQRLALKRSIATIGRDENCDIWLDDDLASRHHAELAWHEGQVYLTDCESMNGVLLNSKPVRGSVPVATNDIIEVGSHSFLFIRSERAADALDDDPLSRHTWRSSMDLFNLGPYLPSSTQIEKVTNSPTISAHKMQDAPNMAEHPHHTPDLQRHHLSQQHLRGMLLVQNGGQAGKSFFLDRPLMTLGRGIECDIVINDTSIFRWHAQVLHQSDGDYLQDLTNRNGTKVNNEALTAPHRLQVGDNIYVGTIQMTYMMQDERTTPLPPTIIPQLYLPSGPRSGPLPLRLPSKQKEH